MTSQQITLDGITYDIIRVTWKRESDAGVRREFALKRPRGRKVYHAVQYESGEWSSVC